MASRPSRRFEAVRVAWRAEGARRSAGAIGSIAVLLGLFAAHFAPRRFIA